MSVNELVALLAPKVADVRVIAPSEPLAGRVIAGAPLAVAVSVRDPPPSVTRIGSAAAGFAAGAEVGLADAPVVGAGVAAPLAGAGVEPPPPQAENATAQSNRAGITAKRRTCTEEPHTKQL
jgi:hypothetical protein